MSKESSIIKRVQLKFTAQGARLFRNTTGGAWTGNVTEEMDITTNRRGTRVTHVVEIMDARFVKYGLTIGGADLVGWQTVVNERGERVAQFLAVECKSNGYRYLTPEQRNFLQQVKSSGGAAYVARETDTGDVVLEEV